MTSDRPYRKALTEEEALDEITRMSGIQFRPELVTVFIELMKKHSVYTMPLSVKKAVR
jgi:HD-GYP domain-containing protein (c-di-GMP phosphodiesterase class II)